MEINKPVRIGVDKLSDGLVTDVYSRETPSGQPRVAFAELENFEPTNNDKLITTQPFLPTSSPTVVQLPSRVMKRAVASQREGVIVFAVDSNGVWRSQDGGLTWALVRSQTTLRSVAALSNRRVVAVGENGVVLRSTTFGDSWTVLPAFTEETLQDVTAVEATTFVAVGELFVYQSTDSGETWTRSYATGFQVAHEQLLTGSYRGVKVAHADGVYVSVAPNDARVVRSNDGLSWRESAMLSADEWTAVVGAEVSTTVSSTGRLFVAVARDTNTCWRSIDGVTWTSHAIDTSTSAPNRQWVQVSYANGWFVAVSENANVVARSQNGIAWTLHTIDTSTGAPNRNWSAVTYVSQGLPYWILLARGSGVVARSFNDGATWVVGDFGLPSFQWRDVVFANGRLVAVHDSTSAQVAVSLDGVTWSLASFPFSVSQRGIAFGNGRFVVTTSGTTSGTSFMHSTNGETWEATSSGVSAGDWAFVAAHQDKFLTMQYNGVGQAETLYSYDGIVWYSSITRVPERAWRVAASGNGVAVAAATDSGGLVRVGQDGRRWTVSNAPNRETTGIAFGAGIFLASVPDSSEFLFSTTNGATFQLTASVFNDRQWRGVASKGNLFVVVAEGTNVVARVTYTSPSTFTVVESSVGLNVRNWNYIAYCPESDAFVAVAENDWVIAESNDDGATWTEYDLGLITGFDTNKWRSIAYGNGLVVVVAVGSKTFAVGDGTGAWAPVSNGLTTRDWVRVSYQRGVFCAVATDGTIAYSTSPATQWTEVPNAIPSSTLSNIGAFVGHEGKFVGIYKDDTRQVVWGGQYCVDARGSTVVVGGEQGYVARSTDSGATWTRVQQNETTDVFRRTTDISMVSTTTALTTEGIESGSFNTGIVRRSTDSGATWARVYAGGGVLWTVGAPSATEIIAAGNARVIRSVNSGVTWAQINDAPLFHRTMVARNGQAVILGQGQYMLYASQASVPFTTAVSFSPSMFRASATVLQAVITYDDAAQSGKYLLTDAWRFKTETNLAYLYEYSAFREEEEAYRRQSERIYYLNDVPVSLPLVTFATQGDRDLQKFIVSSTDNGEVKVRVFRPPMTLLNGGQVRVSQRLTIGDVRGVVSETYYLPTDKRLPMSPTNQEFEAFEKLVKGCIGTVAYGVSEVSGDEVVFRVKTVAAQVVGVSRGTTVNGTPYLDITFRAAREMEKSSGNVVGQFPTVSTSVGSLCFYSVQIFYSQYGYKVWHGVEGTERRVAIPLSQVVLPTDLESEFVFQIARAWIQRPIVYQGNAVWALPSAVTPRRTGGDSGSTYVNDRLYVDVAPNMVVFESEPKTMLDLPQHVRYNEAENKKVGVLFKQKFYSEEYSYNSSTPFVQVTSVVFSPSSSGLTWSYRYVILPNNEDYYIELEVVADATVPSGSYSMTATLSNSAAITATFNIESTDGYVRARDAVFERKDTHWKRLEVETPDTTEAVTVSLQAKPFLTPPFDTASSTTRTLSFSVPASITQTNTGRNEFRFYYYQLLLSPNNPNELTAPTTSTPEVRAVNFFVNNTLGRSLTQIADNIKTALEDFFPSSNPTVTIQSRSIQGGQLNGILTTIQVYYDINVVFTGSPSPSDYLAVRARQSFTVGSFASLIQPAPELFFPFPTQRIPIGANTVDSHEESYWHAGLTDTNAFYTVAVTAVYDGYEESDVIAWTSARGQFDYDYQTQRFSSFLFECDARLNLAAIGKRLSYLKVYVGKFPQQSVQRSETPSQQTVFVAGVYETISSDFDVSLLNAMTWVGVVIVDKAYAEQFDKGIFVLEGSFQPSSGPLVRGGRYYFAPREAGTAMVLSGVELGDDEFSWVGGNFDTPQSDGGGLVTVNALYPNQRDMPPYISGAWVSRTRRSFEPFFVSVKFRVTGAMFQRGLVQYRRGNTTTTYQSFIIPNGATSMMIRATSVSPPSVSDRVVYEAVPTGLGSVVNPNGTLSENLGRLVKSASEVKLFRDRISSGVSVVVAGRRYFFMVRDEDGEVMIDRSISVRTAVAQGVPQYSFVDASFERQTNLVQYETQVAGDIVSAVRNRYNDFSENLRVLLVQDVQSKLLSVQGDSVPTVIQEFDGVSSVFARATTLTPYGICMMSPQGLYLINDNQVQMLSGAIDTLWRKEFDNQQAAINGDYPKESSATANPFVAQGFYDVETRRFYAMRNAKAFVYDFEKKCWFVNSLIGGLTTAFAILPARVMREENESLVVPAVSFDTPEVIQNYTRDVRYQLSPDTQEYEADSLMTTNVFVAPPDLEYQVKRVSVVLSGGTSTALVERKCQVDIIEASTGNDGNVSIDGGNVTNIFEFDMGNSASERRHFDVPVNIGKNVRAFAVRVTTQNVRVVVEELNVTVIPRRRPVSQGIATLNVFVATPPTVELPTVLPDTYPLPIPNNLLIPTVFSVRVSNPLLPSVIRNVVLYDILVYLDEARTQFFASIQNLTTAEVVEASVSSVLFRDITNTPVVFQGGRVYYGIARCRYLSTQADTLFEFATRLSAPTLSGFPLSVEVPTVSFFQGTAQRGVTNALATQAEFEWQVGATPQSNVTAFYNSSGNATGIFNLPSITTPTLIKVRGRSRNSEVIGDWSAYVDINVTLFRPSPQILFFNPTSNRIALNAQPASQAFLNLQFSYADAFGGNCTWKIERVDNSQLISNGAQTTNPHSVTNISVPLPSLSSKQAITYRLTVTNPNNESASSDIDITYFPRPSISGVFFFYNPNYQTYQDVSKSALANQNGHPVGLIEDEIDSTRKVEQNVIANKPILVAAGSRFYLESSVSDKNLRQSPSDNALPTVLSERNNFTWIMVGNFPNQTGEICQPVNLVSSATDIILGFWIGSVRFRLGISIAPDIVLPNSPTNTWNIMQVVVVTYEKNTTNGFKVYSSLYPTSSNRLVGQQNTSNNTLGGASNDRMTICRALVTNPLFPRRAGHIISLKRTLSESEVLAWIDWLCAYYQITPAP